jgi:hypothetical protein
VAVRTAALVTAAAAAAVIVVLGVQVADLRSRVDDVAKQVVPPVGQGTVAVAMRSPDGTRVVDAVLTSDGTGYVIPGNLPALPVSQTYQLWKIVDGRRVSVGVLGPSFGVSTFKAEGRIDMLAITREDAPGATTSDRSPEVIGPVRRTA